MSRPWIFLASVLLVAVVVLVLVVAVVVFFVAVAVFVVAVVVVADDGASHHLCALIPLFDKVALCRPKGLQNLQPFHGKKNVPRHEKTNILHMRKQMHRSA